jgi:hypothetical protein
MSDTIHSGPGWRQRPDGHVNHGGPILDRHDYRDWVEWTLDERGTLGALPDGVRVRHEFSTGEPNIGRYYVHPDDVPTDPDAELIERVALGLSDNVQEYHRTVARGIIALVRDHDKADR